MQCKPVRFGPIALTIGMTTNLLNPGATTGGVGMPANSGNLYYYIKHIRIINKTSTPQSVSLWLGASGGNVAGTEIIAQGTVVPANSYVDIFGVLTMDTSDYLVGGATANASLVLHAEGEIGIR